MEGNGSRAQWYIIGMVFGIVVVTLLILMAIILTFSLTVGSSSASTDGETLVDVASGDNTFSRLVIAVGAAELVEALEDEGPFTVFAPTNEAFDATVAELGMTAQELLADTESLREILLYHVIEGEVLAGDVLELDGETVNTLQGAEISISIADGTVTLNDTITVTATDIQAANGVIHVIDGVLIPERVLALQELENAQDADAEVETTPQASSETESETEEAPEATAEAAS